MAKILVLTNSITNFFFKNEIKNATKCDDSSKLSEYNLEEFDFIFDFTPAEGNFLYDYYLANEAKKFCDGTLLCKKDVKTSYVQFDYKQIFIQSRLLPEEKRLPALKKADKVKVFMERLFTKINSDNTNFQKDDIINSGVNITGLVDNPKGEYRLVQSKENIVPEKGVHYITLKEQNFLANAGGILNKLSGKLKKIS